AKGISSGQNILKLPSAKLKATESGLPAAIIGKMMAKSSRLEAGDVFTMRIKDIDGAFNTVDLQIVEVMNTPVASIDTGNIWVELETLRELKLMPDRASVLVLSDEALARESNQDFRHISHDEYFADLYSILETEKGQQYIMFGLLLFLAMLAIFDTQALALFRRRKEIGTLSALGMTKRQIILLFTSEGVMYMLFAVVMGAVLGFPFFYYFAVKGYVLPAEYDEFGMIGFSEPIKFLYPPGILLGTILFMFVLTAFVSWLPARRISSMKITDALRGKVN
ncbi:MAG: FtsX-like permease family protein, partial [Candidatus Cloacimonadaceae bacterium]|nr:FtsX-like permease family protein [Candidatus Cloacimonadaceae bacterium]